MGSLPDVVAGCLTPAGVQAARSKTEAEAPTAVAAAQAGAEQGGL
jgi:hypothetical protein